MTARDVLAAIARMMLLCGALGSALYLALMAFIEGVGDAHLWFTALSSVAGAVVIGSQLYSALRRGEFHASRLTTYSRTGEPFRYWGSIAFSGACVASLLAIFAWVGFTISR